MPPLQCEYGASITTKPPNLLGLPSYQPSFAHTGTRWAALCRNYNVILPPVRTSRSAVIRIPKTDPIHPSSQKQKGPQIDHRRQLRDLRDLHWQSKSLATRPNSDAGPKHPKRVCNEMIIFAPNRDCSDGRCTRRSVDGRDVRTARGVVGNPLTCDFRV